MAAEVLQVRYAELEEVARRFKAQAEAISALQGRVRRAYDALKIEGWQGLGSDAFTAEMTTCVFPVLERLCGALQEGSRAAAEIGRALGEAELRAARLFAASSAGEVATGVAAASEVASGGGEQQGAKVGVSSEVAGIGHMPGKRDGLDVEFLRRLDSVAARMKAAGYDTKINSGRRTLEEQVGIYTRGRTFEQFGAGMLAEVQKKHISADEAQKWIDHYDPAKGGHPMQQGYKSPVTWTVKSVHLQGKAADIIDPDKGWDAPKGYWDALKQAAAAEGLRIGPPASDRAHVQMKQL